MAFLDTYNETLPTGGQSVGGGDDIFRALATAIKNTFGVEHALTGEHKFAVGTTAARPAAGTAGRLYVNTETNRLEYDSGATWSVLGGPSYVRVGGGATLGILKKKVVETSLVLTSSRIVVYVWTIHNSDTPSSPCVLDAYIARDLFNLIELQDFYLGGSAGYGSTLLFFTETLPAGTYTIGGWAKVSVGTMAVASALYAIML